MAAHSIAVVAHTLASQRKNHSNLTSCAVVSSPSIVAVTSALVLVIVPSAVVRVVRRGTRIARRRRAVSVARAVVERRAVAEGVLENKLRLALLVPGSVEGSGIGSVVGSDSGSVGFDSGSVVVLGFVDSSKVSERAAISIPVDSGSVGFVPVDSGLGSVVLGSFVVSNN